MADESNPTPPAGDHTPEGTTPSWDQSNPYATLSGDAASSDSNALGSYGGGRSSPYSSYSPSSYGQSAAQDGSSGSGDTHVDGSADEQVTDLSNPYGQTSGSSYSQASYGESPYGQASSPYGQADAAPGAAYSASTTPYQPEVPVGASPYGQPAGPSPYAQPSAPAYGQQLPGQPMPGQPLPAYEQAPYGAEPYQPAQARGMNVLGLISLIVGIFGIVLIIFGGAAMFFGLVGIVLGVLGLVLKKFNASKGLAIAGTIVSALAFVGGIISLILAIVLSSAFSSTVDSFDSATYPVEVTMTVSSTGTSPVDINYNVDNGVSGENAYEVSDALFAEPAPWEMTTSFNINDVYDYSSVSMDVDADNYDDTISCEITINDKVVAKDSGTGFAYCSVYGIYAYLSGTTTAP